MKQWLIYKHTALKSKKAYIGLTSGGMESRWVRHKSEARNGSDRHFHRAIRLYGEENWQHEVLEDGIDTLEEANALERHYIKKYDTFENGYNLTEGGDAFLSDESLASTHTQRMRDYYGVEKTKFWDHSKKESLYGYPGDIEKEYGYTAGSLSAIARGDGVSYKGITTYENYLKGITPWPNLIKFEHKDHGVVEDSLDNMIRRFPELSRGTLSAVVYGSRAHHKGWTLEGNQKKIGIKPQDPKSKPVLQYDANTKELLAEFPSVNKAATVNNLSAATIRKKCTGELKTEEYSGFIFKYKDKE
jgi:group I intron endonuclease